MYFPFEGACSHLFADISYYRFSIGHVTVFFSVFYFLSFRFIVFLLIYFNERNSFDTSAYYINGLPSIIIIFFYSKPFIYLFAR